MERLRLWQQVQAQARRVQRVMDTVPVGVLLLDGERRVVVANPLGEEYLAALSGAVPGEVLTRLGAQGVDRLLSPAAPGGDGTRCGWRGHRSGCLRWSRAP